MAKRNRTREARERRQKQQRQNQQRLILVGVVIVALIVVALVIVSSQPTDAFIPQDLTDKYEDIPRSTSVEGYPRLGDPDAPVIIEEYSSFSCPGCEAFHGSSFSAIVERVKLGQVLFTYIPLQTGSIPNAEGAARASLCAGQQGSFWEMHDLLFDWHTRYGNTAFTQSRLLAGIEGLGLNPDSFNSCFFSQIISDTLENALLEGVNSTPTIDVNGVNVASSQSGGIPTTEELLQAIDSATPADWVPGASSETAPENDSDETENIDEPTPEVDVEVTDEPDTSNSETEVDVSEAETAEPESTEEAGD